MDKDVYYTFNDNNYLDLTMFQFGYQQCVSLHSFGPAVRDHYLFHYILSGKGQLMSIDSKGEAHEYDLQAGQGFLISPYQRNIYTADKDDPWVYTWIEFDGIKAKEYTALSGLSFDNPVYTGKNNEDQEIMKNEMLFIVNNSHRPPSELIGHLYLFISALMNSSVKVRKTTGESLKDFYIREALNYIQHNYNKEDLTIEEIAYYCNLNRSYLGKIFKNHMHISLQEFLIKFRMEKACQLLQITDHSIGDISNMIGYTNQLHFSRAFRKVFNEPPREWRKKNRLR